MDDERLSGAFALAEQMQRARAHEFSTRERRVANSRSRWRRLPPTHVYVIADPGYAVKIGITRVPAVRLAQLQRGNPRPLRLAYTSASERPEIVETLVHAALMGFWMQGEWFCATVAQAIEAVKRASEEAQSL